MLRLTKRLKREIEAHAQGSLYRMNANSADCYAFSLYRNSAGRLDFQGGWDWLRKLVDTTASRVYIMETGEFRRLGM